MARQPITPDAFKALLLNNAAAHDKDVSGPVFFLNEDVIDSRPWVIKNCSIPELSLGRIVAATFGPVKFHQSEIASLKVGGDVTSYQGFTFDENCLVGDFELDSASGNGAKVEFHGADVKYILLKLTSFESLLVRPKATCTVESSPFTTINEAKFVGQFDNLNLVGVNISKLIIADSQIGNLRLGSTIGNLKIQATRIQEGDMQSLVIS